MKVLDLFSGLEGWSEPFRERGHEVVSVDIEETFQPDIVADVLDLQAMNVYAALAGDPDIILASPPCTTFSMMALGKHWTHDNQPKTEAARISYELVKHTIGLAKEMQPAFFIMENPVAKLRKMEAMQELPRRTVTYCAYGYPFRKPTDLWGWFPPSLVLRPQCKNGQACHIRAERGSRTGVQGGLEALRPYLKEQENARQDRLRAIEAKAREGGNPDADRGYLYLRYYQARAAFGTGDNASLAALRAKIPYQLALDVCLAAERDFGVAAGDRGSSQSSLLGGVA